MTRERETTAVVVGLVDYGEADRIVRLLSPELGNVSALAKGVRRSSKRFRGALEPGNRLEVTLRQGRTDLLLLRDAKLVDGRLHVRKDLVCLSLLAYACEVAGGLARQSHPEPKLFGLLEMGLLVLDAATEPPTDAFRIGLEAKALSFAGLAPSLMRCPSCGEGLEQGALVFAPSVGGVAHAACHTGEPVSYAWTQAVETARRTPLRDLVDTTLPPGPAWALSDLLIWHLGRPLKSRGVLQAVAPPRVGR